MNRDEFVDEAQNDGPVVARPGHQLFLVSIESEGRDTERFVRAAMFDYFGSMVSGVRPVKFSPADIIVGEHPKVGSTTISSRR